jgi:UV DNA damage endonuclease
MPAGRIGFCCTFVPEDGDESVRRAMNMRTVTLAWLARQTPAAAFDRLAEVVAHNLDTLDRQIAYTAALPREERMFRILSGFLPFWSHPATAELWRDGDLRTLVERRLAASGEAARAGDVRLSMHPGQHAVLATLRADARANGARDIMDHAEVFAMMGYDGGWHPHGAHINVHGGAAAAGVEGIRVGLAKLPAAARDLLTIENDEYAFGLDALLPLADEVALVVDFHHHWVHSGGEYLQPEDPRVDRLKRSWRGARPVTHISVSPEALYDVPVHDEAPDYAGLNAAGFGKHELRAHSQMMWNLAVNDLVARHLAWCDVEVEAKGKNLASRQLADHVRAAELTGTP